LIIGREQEALTLVTQSNKKEQKPETRHAIISNKTNKEVKLETLHAIPSSNISKIEDEEVTPGDKCTCRSTCYTPEANQPNSIWPWKNQSQRDFFYPRTASEMKLKEKPAVAKGHAIRRNHTYAPRFNCNRSLNLPPSIYSTFEHHLFFIPEGKLIFCGIPKSGISEWIKFFRFAFGAQDYLSFAHFKSDRAQFFVRSLTMEKAKELLNDPTWTRAVFFREPAERLLSAYLNKIEGGKPTEHNFTDWVDEITTQKDAKCGSPGLNACTDPHWTPQLMTCGLDYLLPSWDFIGTFEHIAEHTKLLLERVGLWDNFGAKFDDASDYKTGGGRCHVAPPIRASNYSALGFNQRGTSKGQSNAAGAQNKFDKYYTPELLGKVRELYALDYAIWDDLKKRPADRVATGRDLDIVRANCQDLS
jgi:hypothetical protein